MNITNVPAVVVNYPEIESIVSVLSQGGLILFPTDTVWGIGADAFYEPAVARVRSLKQADPADAFVVLVDNIARLRALGVDIHPRLETLMVYHHRPMTVIYETAPAFPDYLKTPDGSVAIRIVQDEFCRSIIRTLDKPIIGTAACRSDQAPPVNFGSISTEIIQGVQYVVRYRQQDKTPGEPSVIVRLDEREELDFIRT